MVNANYKIKLEIILNALSLPEHVFQTLKLTHRILRVYDSRYQIELTCLQSDNIVCVNSCRLTNSYKLS